MKKLLPLQRNIPNLPEKRGERKWTIQPLFDFTAPAGSISFMRIIFFFVICTRTDVGKEYEKTSHEAGSELMQSHEQLLRVVR